MIVTAYHDDEGDRGGISRLLFTSLLTGLDVVLRYPCPAESLTGHFQSKLPMIIFALAALFGAVIGSFLGCCIYRLPRGQYYTYSDEELDALGDELPAPTPFNEPVRSVCPQCSTQLLWWHNIPLLSWLLLRGRCHFCKAKIPFRYFLVEALTTGAAVGVVASFGLTPTSFVIFTLIAALIVLTFIDIDWFILPDLITLSGSVIALVIVTINHFFHLFSYPIAPDLWEGLYGLLGGAGVLWLVAKIHLWIRNIDGLGLGDVKLLMMTGILLGPQSAIYSIFVGSVLGAIIGSLSLLVQRKGFRHNYIPFGPYLAAATVLYLFSSTWILEKFGELVSYLLLSLGVL